jgi:hypothetical protein
MCIGFYRKKLNKRKLDQIWYSDYRGPNCTKYYIWGHLDILFFLFSI